MHYNSYNYKEILFTLSIVQNTCTHLNNLFVFFMIKNIE